MPNFEELFIKSKGMPIDFKGKKIFMMDEYEIHSGDRFCLSVEKHNSEWKQGIYIETKGLIIINNQKIKNKIVLWQDTSPKVVKYEIKVKKPEKILIKNVWDLGDGFILNIS